MCTEIPTATCAGVSVGITRARSASKSSPAIFLRFMFESSRNLPPPTRTRGRRSNYPTMLEVQTRGRQECCGTVRNSGIINGSPWMRKPSVAITQGFFEPGGDLCVEFQPQSKPSVYETLAINHPCVRFQFPVGGLDQ